MRNPFKKDVKKPEAEKPAKRPATIVPDDPVEMFPLQPIEQEDD